MKKGRCKYSGCMGLKHTCAIGLDPEAMARATAAPGTDPRVGLGLRLPCDSKEFDTELFNRGGPMNESQREAIEHKAHCDKFTEPSDEEIAEYDRETKASIERMTKTFPLIERVKKEHVESWVGVETCPVCGGKLHLRVNVFSGHEGSQKHFWGRCETEGCVSWIE